jgi:hypothetical protein
MTTKCEHVPENGDSATTSCTKCGRVIEWNRNTLRWILFTGLRRGKKGVL